MAHETKPAAKSNDQGGNDSAAVTALKDTAYGLVIQICSLSLLVLIAVKGMVVFYIFLAAGPVMVLLDFYARKKVQAPGISRDQSGDGREGPSQSQADGEKENPELSQSNTTSKSDRYFTCIICLLIVAVAIAQYKIAQSGKQPCCVEEFPHNEYQFAVRAKGKCSPAAARSQVEGALDQYVDYRMPESVCAVHCTRLTYAGEWRGYVAFGAESYDWEEWLERCSTVGKRGECGEKQ